MTCLEVEKTPILSGFLGGIVLLVQNFLKTRIGLGFLGGFSFTVKPKSAIFGLLKLHASRS